MGIMQIAAVGIVAAVLSVTVRKQAPEFSLIIGIAAGIIIFLSIIPELTKIYELIQRVTSMTDIGMENTYIPLILKIVGIAYIAEFASQICIDAGEGAIASKIELGGKVLIMVVASPILMALLNQIFAILPA